MCAQFTEISEAFAAKRLRLPCLNCLEPNEAFYETLAIQPKSTVTARPGFVGHADHAAAVAKFTAFLQLATQSNCDLALCPEYSMPWDVLTQAIVASTLPQEGKLWILGCEAITREALAAFIAAHPQVDWIHEPIPAGAGTFLGVLAYATKAQAIAGGVKNVIVLQFKTAPMGGPTFERDNLICGQVIYIWRNPRDNIRLISLVCSDALGWDPNTAANCRFDRDPYLIFHPQLNPDPRHVGISAYRNALFSLNANVSQRFEVITLNWARGFDIPPHAASAYGGSTIYTKSPEFEFSDARIEENHHRGLYFAFWQAQRTQLCIFNFDERVFRFRSLKVLQVVAGPKAARTGPHMQALYCWNAAHSAWHEVASADDGFADFCTAQGEPTCDYCLAAPNTPLARERLFMLSAGKLQNLAHRDGWHHVRNLDSVEAEADERSKRITFTHEEAPDSRDYRQIMLGRFITLQLSILANPDNYPDNIRDLRGDCRLEPPTAATHFRSNLASQSGTKARATGVFLGQVPAADAAKLRDEIIAAWSQADKPVRRLVVWYDRHGQFHHAAAPLPSFLDGTEPPTSFIKDSRP